VISFYDFSFYDFVSLSTISFLEIN